MLSSFGTAGIGTTYANKSYFLSRENLLAPHMLYSKCNSIVVVVVVELASIARAVDIEASHTLPCCS
jgi:hypothetical protein